MSVAKKTSGEVLEAVKKKYPIPSVNANWNLLREDPEFFETLIEAVSSGHSIRDFAQAVDIPAGRITGWLARLEGTRSQAYANARQARAMIFADRILQVMEEVRDGLLPPAQGKFLADNMIWMASRLDPAQWGNKIQVKADIKSTTEMHLLAVQELAQRVRVGDDRPVIEGEVEPENLVVPDIRSEEYLLS